MTTCPASGALVPTGHRTFDLNLTAMIAPRSFRCTACKEIHTWTAEVATIEEAKPPTLHIAA